MNGGRGMGL
ncbi:hypothetical protein Avbf_05347 [Armadillidium vulgare]|nr:hypothetical protein Avbf_05347 [Armadillidium vulgare]